MPEKDTRNMPEMIISGVPYELFIRSYRKIRLMSGYSYMIIIYLYIHIEISAKIADNKL